MQQNDLPCRRKKERKQGEEKKFSRLKENGEETKKVQFFGKRKLSPQKNNFTQNEEKWRGNDTETAKNRNELYIM